MADLSVAYARKGQRPEHIAAPVARIGNANSATTAGVLPTGQ